MVADMIRISCAGICGEDDSRCLQKLVSRTSGGRGEVLLLAPIFPPHHNGQAAGEQKAKDAQPHGHRGAVHGQFNMIEKAHKMQDSHHEKEDSCDQGCGFQNALFLLLVLTSTKSESMICIGGIFNRLISFNISIRCHYLSNCTETGV